MTRRIPGASSLQASLVLTASSSPMQPLAKWSFSTPATRGEGTSPIRCITIALNAIPNGLLAIGILYINPTQVAALHTKIAVVAIKMKPKNKNFALTKYRTEYKPSPNVPETTITSELLIRSTCSVLVPMASHSLLRFFTNLSTNKPPKGKPSTPAKLTIAPKAVDAATSLSNKLNPRKKDDPKVANPINTAVSAPYPSVM
mmetsp:Transcript_23126/g.39133  ORF Transcript_23126/g.39133 Transcript_23126/m.39133 type:complete len:201 (+) Transcript_23126:242-844(+)